MSCGVEVMRSEAKHCDDVNDDVKMVPTIMMLQVMTYGLSAWYEPLRLTLMID